MLRFIRAAYLSLLAHRYATDRCCYQAWLLENTIFIKKPKKWGIENV